MHLRMKLIGGMYQVYLCQPNGVELTLLGSGWTDDAARESAGRALAAISLRLLTLEVEHA